MLPRGVEGSPVARSRWKTLTVVRELIRHEKPVAALQVVPRPVAAAVDVADEFEPRTVGRAPSNVESRFEPLTVT